jgi:hypothetical protein
VTGFIVTLGAAEEASAERVELGGSTSQVGVDGVDVDGVAGVVRWMR